MAGIEFDMEKFLRVSNRLDISDVDWAQVREHPLTSADLKVMSHMMDTEYHTIMYLRELLHTSCAADPDVTAFMSCWNFEELWHGEFFSRFFREYGIPGVERRQSDIRRDLVGLSGAVKLGRFMAASTLIRDFVAISMTWGALNELTACHAYTALARQSGHPVLQKVLPRIVKQERRHFAFYAAQARQRMARASHVPWLVRKVVDRVWAPVGSGLRQREDMDFIMLYLFDNPEGRQQLAEADAQFESIPGMEGARPLQRQFEASSSRWKGEKPGREIVPPMADASLFAVAG